MSRVKSSMDKIIFGEKLRAFRKAQGITLQVFADKLNTSNGYLSAVERGQKKPGADLIFALKREYGFQIEDGPTPSERTESSDKDYIHIPLYDVRAAAGDGSYVDTEDKKDLLIFRRWFIEEELRGKAENFSLIFVDGESMIPTLRPGEIIMVDHRDRAFQRDGVYIIQMDGTLIVKTVRNLPDNQAEIISDNPAYGKFSINKKEPPPDFRVVGRVVWTGKRM